MHSRSSSHRSEADDVRRQAVPVTLPMELFTNRIAQELQNRSHLNITQALASLDSGLPFPRIFLHVSLL